MRTLPFAAAVLAIVAATPATAAIASFDVTPHGFTLNHPSDISPVFVELGSRSYIEQHIVTQTTYWNGNNYISRYMAGSYDVRGGWADDYSECCILQYNDNASDTIIKYTGTLKLSAEARHRLVDAVPTFTIRFSSPYPGPYPHAYLGIGRNASSFVEMLQGPQLHHSLQGKISLDNGAESVDFTAKYDAHALGAFALHITGPTYDLGTYRRELYEHLDTAVVPVPEPSTWVMLLSGVLLLGAAIRRQNS